MPGPPAAVVVGDDAAADKRRSVHRDATTSAVAGDRRLPLVIRILGIGLLLLAWPLFRPIYKTDPRWQWLAAILYWGWLGFLVVLVVLGLH
jgi:hypothetical protein